MEKTIHEESNLLHPMLKDKKLAWLLIAISASVMIIDNFLKMHMYVGTWHIIMYLLFLTPLTYLIWKKKVQNSYTKWFLPILVIMIVDMFYYNNDMVQAILPVIFYLLVIILYLTSMHKVHSFYQTLLPRMALPFNGLGIGYIKDFLGSLVSKKEDKQLYTRIGIALLITLPFLGVFIALLFEADSNYSYLIKNLFRFDISIELSTLLTTPLYFFVYLLLFIYGLSNNKERDVTQSGKKLDLLIVGIFLSMINILFLSFIALQVPFLLSSDFTPKGNIANFAREGFFQLIMVMGLVVLIFLFIMRRFHDEKLLSFLLVGLLSQTIIMGIVSLKKMYLYQSIKGATSLRYYVEWFDYYLILVLALGIFFLLRKYTFNKLLDVISVLGVLAFTLIVSLNINAMVAKHNIERFKTSDMLDMRLLKSLSIDALPAIRNYEKTLNRNLSYPEIASEIYHSTKPLYPEAEMVIEYAEVVSDTTKLTTKPAIKALIPWYQNQKRKDCTVFASYHWGYCAILKEYGPDND
ncbi:MAG: hypothetical protein COA92_03205 [Sulfurovum sp.]|nr:MAG: hypothetical protein COA92_03205 [Sulfurovum sp.]